MKAQFGDVDLAGKRCGVERLDVGHAHVEFEAFEIDAPVHHRIEHETVVGAGREAEREPHSSLSIRNVVAPRLATASDNFHASRLRRSTTFDTARTCANRWLWTRHAYMN